MENQTAEQSQHYSVSFRIIGDDLEPSSLTSLLGIEPDTAHKKGDPRTGTTKSGKTITYAPFSNGVWAIKSCEPKEKDIQEHIVSILTRIEPHKDKLIELSKRYKMDFYCGYFFSTNDQASISLSSEVLKRISDLRIELGISLYST